MSNKITLTELAEILSKNSKLISKKSEWETFLRLLFAEISDALGKDKSVKIKGLGTFKLVMVEPRKSVNIKTGEALIIPSHPKISFTPDTALAATINKPYSHLEVYTLKENGPIDPEEKEDTDNDILPETPASENTANTIVEEQPNVIIPPVIEPTPVVLQTPIVEQTIEVKQETSVVQPTSTIISTPIVEPAPVVETTPSNPNLPTGIVKASEEIADVIEKINNIGKEEEKVEPIVEPANYVAAQTPIVEQTPASNVSVNTTLETTTPVVETPIVEQQTNTQTTPAIEVTTTPSEEINSTESKADSPVENNVVEEIKNDSTEEISVDKEKQVSEESNSVVEEAKKENSDEKESVPTETTETPKENVEESKEEEKNKNSKKLGIAIIIFVTFVAILGTILWFSDPNIVNKIREKFNSVVNTETTANPEILPADSTVKAERDTVSEAIRDSLLGYADEETNIEIDESEQAEQVEVAPQPAVEKKIHFRSDFLDYMSENHPNIDLGSTDETETTIEKGDRLTLVSLRNYGIKDFWVYLYLYNYDIIKNPNNIRPGTTIKVPELDMSLINSNSEDCINLAREIKAKFINN